VIPREGIESNGFSKDFRVWLIGPN